MSALPKLSVAALTLALIVTSAATAQRSRGSYIRYPARSRTVVVPVYVNGVRLGTDALMIKRVARTVLPMRALFSSLGAQVVWNARERAVYAWKTDGTGVRLALGEPEAQLLLLPGPNEVATVMETRALDAPPTTIGGRMYIPVRAASELLGTEVQWSESEPAVYIGVTPPAE